MYRKSYYKIVFLHILLIGIFIVSFCKIALSLGTGSINVRYPLLSSYMDEDNISLKYCEKNTYLKSDRNIHNGIDISVPVDKPVFSICAGEVVYDNTSAGYWDSFLVLKYNCNGKILYGYYGHVYSSVKNPKDIKAGDKIAIIRHDTSGKIGDHLHLSISTGKDWDHYGWGYDYSCKDANADGYKNPLTYLRFTAVSTGEAPDVTEFEVPLGKTVNSLTYAQSGNLMYQEKTFRPSVTANINDVQKFKISILKSKNLAAVIAEDLDNKHKLFLIDLSKGTSIQIPPEGISAAVKIYWSPSQRYMVALCSYEGEWFISIDLNTKKIINGDFLGVPNKIWRIKDKPRWIGTSDMLGFTVDEICNYYDNPDCGDKVLATYEIRLDAATLKIQSRQVWTSESGTVDVPKMIGNIKNDKLLEPGCGCSFSIVNDPAHFVFLSNLGYEGNTGKTALMNIDSQDTKLQFVSSTEQNGQGWKKGDRFIEKYIARRIEAQIEYIAKGPINVGSESEATEFDAIITVTKASRTQTVKASGNCGC